MKKSLILFALVFSLLFALPVFADEAEVRDVSFETSLASDLKALGLFSGVSDNDFDLERAPSRTEVLVMLIRVLGEEKTALSGDFTHPFTDVPAWANPYVGYAYENGLTKGISETEFGNGTANAATYLTFMLRALGYSDAKGDFKWDDPYPLAKGMGLLLSAVDTDAFLRADIVTVSYAALSMELKDSNRTLAEKLIEKGVFSAEQYATSYAVAKLVDKENEGKALLTSEQIYSQCAPAVFYIEIQSADGKPLSSGSGFFIDESGIAITNHHVMDGAKKAVVTLSGSGTKYDVTGVYYYSVEHDIAVIQVNGNGFKTLTVNPMPAKGAASVYAIGSPRGLQNTISQGIVSNPRRIVEGETYIQTTAAISNGSSGGALLNSYGEVIGITSAGYDVGQNLNFARPISYLATVNLDSATPVADVNWNYVKYMLREESYTVEAGKAISFEFDTTLHVAGGKLPVFKTVSSNTDVAIAAPLFDDTFVSIVGVAPGTAEITLSDDASANSVTFTVTVTEGEVKAQPYVEYFASVDNLMLSKGAKNTIRISAVAVGADKAAEWSVTSRNSTILKVSKVNVGERFITVDVSAVKNGRTELVVKSGITDDELIIPVTVGEQFYTAFDTMKDYTIANGKFNDADDDTNDYYLVEGITYSNGDIVNLVYYPAVDALHMRVTSVLAPVTVELILTRESATTGKKLTFLIDYSAIEVVGKAVITKPETFGDGKSDSIYFDEYKGEESYKETYEKLSPRLLIALLYEFDRWFSYILPGTDASDLGFIAADYAAYGVNFAY